MAIGDQQDIFTRLKAVLPRWFGDTTPILDAVLNGFASAFAFIYSQYAYAKLQTRIKSATDDSLDYIAADFFGTTVQRKNGQSDSSFRTTILINLFRERATRAGLIKILTDITGRVPKVVEPVNMADTGEWGGPFIGYGVAGAYGSMLIPYQAFVTVYRPLGVNAGLPYINGYGQPAGGYGVASRADYAAAGSLIALTDADIYAAIDSVKPVGTIVWTSIVN